MQGDKINSGLQIEIRMEAQNAVREREKVLNEEVSRLREELERQKVSQTAVIEQGRKSFSFSEISN